MIVKKRQRRLTGMDNIVLSLTAKGLTSGEISAHLAAEVTRWVSNHLFDGGVEAAVLRSSETGTQRLRADRV